MLGSGKKKRYAFLVMGVGITLFLILIFSRTPPAKRAPVPPPAPLVEVIVVHPGKHTLQVHTQGNVQPRREIDLVAQVTGKIIAASPLFADGSFFDQGQLLVSIEQDDYLIARQQAKASVADAEQLLAAERGRARQAKREWRDLGNPEANALFLRKPQLASAKAALLSAKAGLEKAQLDVRRTQISAPFAGRIRNTLVNVGQYVTVGTKLARIYSTDVAEVRLPLTDRQSAMLNLPVHYQNISPAADTRQMAIPVRLHSQFGGRKGIREAFIVRTDASIDVESRQLFAVAEIKNPFAHSRQSPQRPPLHMGQFVNAYIDGKTINNALVLPRKALRPQNSIWIVDANKQLRIVQVDVLQSSQNQIVVRNGFNGPQQVVISGMSLAVNGMALNPKVVASADAKTKQLSQTHTTEAAQ